MVTYPAREVAPGVRVLADSMFPLYLVDGERPLLVDASISPYAPSLLAGLERALAGKKLATIALTHSHYDHTGSLTVLEQEYGAEVIASPRTCEVLQNPKALLLINQLNREFADKLGIAESPVVAPPARLRAVAGGDEIPLDGNRRLRVFDTPGHTRCSVSFLLEPEGIFFIGDAGGVVERNGKFKPLFLSSYGQYVASLRQIGAVGAEMLALPHNTVVRGSGRVSQFVASALAAAEEARDRIGAALTEDPDVERIADQILAGEFPLPTVAGSRTAFRINLVSMVRAIQREFPPGDAI